MFARILGAAPRNEWDGLRFSDSSYWQVQGTRDAAAFLNALPQLLPSGSILYFEGTTERPVSDFLVVRALAAPERIAIGTIWPRPRRYHVPFSEQLVAALEAIVRSTPIAYLCTHVHAYKARSMLLEWYDAFGADPMRISSTLTESSVQSFAARLGKDYRRHDV
jgi:hypothetical protein